MYRLTDGVAMGSPLGSVLADIFVGWCESLLYLFMHSLLSLSLSLSPPPPLVTPLSLVRWIRKDAETTGRLSISNPAAILLPFHSK